jgi:glycosyltransferase involved in cell wall biosynthesis
MMKIAIASSGLGHVTRGVETWAEDLASALSARGQSITLYKGGGQANTPYERVIPCLQRGAAGTSRLLKWLPRRGMWRLGLGSPGDVESNSFALLLLERLRKDKIDILHVQDALVAEFVRKAARCGLVRAQLILGLGSKEPLEFQRKFTYLHHLAPWYLEEVFAAGIRKPTWTWLPNFVDTEVFHPGSAQSMRMELGIPPNAFVVLCAAAIKRGHKRIDYLLNEFAELRRSHPELPVWLVIAGAREPETDELVTIGQTLLGDRVRFLVQFPRERMPELYRMSDLFVLCSLREMFGIVLLEAAASGMYSLVNDHPVLKWVVGSGGEAIDMTAPGRLAATLERLVTNAESRYTLGQLARQHCTEHFGREKVVDRIVRYYEFVYERRCAPSWLKARFGSLGTLQRTQ